MNVSSAVGDIEDLAGLRDHLERLLSIPAAYSAAYLAIDPTWLALRDDPRFQALLEEHGA